jgi:hypothetical protein
MRGVVRSTVAACFAATIGPAFAAPEIGTVVRVQPDVASFSPDRRSLQPNETLIQDEVIQTGASGEAQLRFIDATNLSLSHSSTVKLDKFVFAGKTAAKTFILNATTGSFRFVTGHSAHSAYAINTPAAVIGVRGTRFTFQVYGNQLRLQVEQGAVVVCPRVGHVGCVEAHPGQNVAASADRLPVIIGGPPPPAPAPGLGLGIPAWPINLGLPGLGRGGGGIRPPRLPPTNLR